MLTITLAGHTPMPLSATQLKKSSRPAGSLKATMDKSRISREILSALAQSWPRHSPQESCKPSSIQVNRPSSGTCFSFASWV